MQFELPDNVWYTSRSNAGLVSTLSDPSQSKQNKQIALDTLLSRPPIEDVLVLQLPDEFYKDYLKALAHELNIDVAILSYYYDKNALRIAIRAGRPDLIDAILANRDLTPYMERMQRVAGLHEAILQQNWVAFEQIAERKRQYISIPIRAVAQLSTDRLIFLLERADIHTIQVALAALATGNVPVYESLKSSIELKPIEKSLQKMTRIWELIQGDVNRVPNTTYLKALYVNDALRPDLQLTKYVAQVKIIGPYYRHLIVQDTY